MAERIVVELVRDSRGEPVLVHGVSSDDIDSAIQSYQDALAELNPALHGRMFVRATLTLDHGSATIEGHAASNPEDAFAEFERSRTEYSSGPGWGGPG